MLKVYVKQGMIVETIHQVSEAEYVIREIYMFFLHKRQMDH